MFRRQDPGYIEALIDKKIAERTNIALDPIIIWGQQTYEDSISDGIPIRVNIEDSDTIIKLAKNLVVVYYIDNAQQAFPTTAVFPIRVHGTDNNQIIINREQKADGYEYTYDKDFLPSQMSFQLIGQSDDGSEIYKRKLYLHNFGNVVQFTAFEPFSFNLSTGTGGVDSRPNALKIIQVYFTF